MNIPTVGTRYIVSKNRTPCITENLTPCITEIGRHVWRPYGEISNKRDTVICEHRGTRHYISRISSYSFAISFLSNITGTG
ncbi:MAG: hypothetical protein RR764_10645, partial [Oscillospiraceae bacterium]